MVNDDDLQLEFGVRVCIHPQRANGDVLEVCLTPTLPRQAIVYCAGNRIGIGKLAFVLTDKPRWLSFLPRLRKNIGAFLKQTGRAAMLKTREDASRETNMAE